MRKLEILGLSTVPDIQPGDRLPEVIVACANKEIDGLQEKDIIVVTSKIVSKAEGNLATLSEVRPDKKALALSTITGKPASKVQLILNSGQEIVAVVPLAGLAEKYIMRATRRPDQARQLLDKEASILITRDRKGRLYTFDGGIDSSNHPEGVVSFPPPDPDRSALELRQQVKRLTGREVAVLIADTEIAFFGSLDLALGSSGIETTAKRFGENDKFGKPKFGGMDITAHELTASAALLFGQTDEGIPVVIIRGLDYQVSEQENVLNTLAPDWDGLRRAFKSAIKATAGLRGFRGRLLSWLLLRLV
jgi:coenzyme F420-0:L-glutamate ligase/coenzyme F420-1:gamma-L-glutamate ligase